MNLPFLMMLCTLIGAVPLAAVEKTPEDSVRTSFAIIVGFPAVTPGESSAVLLVPGTVIPLDAERLGPETPSKVELVSKSQAFSSAVSKLWSTFRLDPARRIQKGMRTAARVGVPVNLPGLEGADVKMTATLVSHNATSTTFRVIFTQGQKQLADSTVNVARGGRAVVGGTDGEAAPYIFVFVEPEPAAAAEAAANPAHPAGITQPVLIHGGGPAYPADAKKNKIEGSVFIDVLVGTDGKVEDARAIEYPDESLAQAALGAVQKWEFQPARDESGAAIRVKATIQVNFKLK